MPRFFRFIVFIYQKLKKLKEFRSEYLHETTCSMFEQIEDIRKQMSIKESTIADLSSESNKAGSEECLARFHMHIKIEDQSVAMRLLKEAQGEM